MLLSLVGASAVHGDAWVERMLETKQHDFGIIGRRANATWRLPVKNLYKHKIELLGVRSSCGCTSASLEDELLTPGEVGYASLARDYRSGLRFAAWT
jgi:hypothetical protein